MWCAAAGFALALLNTVPLLYGRSPAMHLHLASWVLAVVAAALAAPVGLARRYPWPVLGVLLTESLVLAGFRTWPWTIYLAADIMVCFIAATRSRRAGLTAAAVTLAAIAADGAVLDLLNGNHKIDGIGLMSLVIAWMAGNSARQWRDYHQALRAQASAQAVTAERLKIARELHDMIAHSIGIIAIQAGAGGLIADAEPARARAALTVIEDTSRQALAALRRMVGALRQAGDTPPGAAAAPGLADVTQLVAAAADAGVSAEVVWRGNQRPLPAEIELAAFRIVQESVTNVVRHAGTSGCQVSIEYRDDELAIEVVDDGRGCSQQQRSGYGIAGMRERVSLLDGHFTAGPRPGGGFRVAARLPVPPAV